MRRLAFVLILLIAGCGSSSGDEDSDSAVIIITNNGDGDGGANNRLEDDPGRLPGDDNLGFMCGEDPSVCGELTCSNELGFQPRRTGECTRSCNPEQAVAEGTPACPIGFQCEFESSGGGAYCMLDLEAVVDVRFTSAYPSEGDGLFDEDGLTLHWDVTQPEPYNEHIEADSYEVYHGVEDEPAHVGDVTETRYTLIDVEDGVRYNWRVVAHFGDQSFESPVWTYTARGEEYDGPCPGRETVQVGDRDVPTRVMSDGRCWLAENIGVGEELTESYALDDGVVQYICPRNGCDRGLYTWYEAHNAYPDLVDDVPSSICPSGFRLPTRAEWEAILQGNINGLRTAYKLFFDGQARPTTGTLELCEDPQTGQQDMKCVRMGSPGVGSGNAFYWTNEVPGSEPLRLHIVHEGGGEYSYEFRTAGPNFASSVRCISQ